ncbi:hypothetical protein KBC03_04655 [Patescibacteria group bacterium]|nr:hypothetical protein [Patescibacteria group bacterium]
MSGALKAGMPDGDTLDQMSKNVKAAVSPNKMGNFIGKVVVKLALTLKLTSREKLGLKEHEKL